MKDKIIVKSMHLHLIAIRYKYEKFAFDHHQYLIRFFIFINNHMNK